MKVAIIGGGAAGLVQALLLQKRNIDVTVFEKLQERPKFKRIIGLDFHSLTILKDLELLEEVEKIGFKIEKANVYENDVQIASVSLKEVNPQFPYFLTISLSELEAFLETRILKIEKGMGVLKVQSGKVILENGIDQDFDLVIAADGPNSRVRDMAGIKVHKYNYPFYLEVANQKVEESEDCVRLYFEKGKSPHLRFPYSKDHVQVIRPIYKDLPAIDQKKTLKGENETIIQVYLDKFVCKTFYKDKVLLLGDSAHHMTPFGGRGLNLAFEDALHYAEAIKHGKIEKEAKRRRKVGKKVVFETHLLAKMASRANGLLLWSFKFFDRHSKFFTRIIKMHLNITKGKKAA